MFSMDTDFYVNPPVLSLSTGVQNFLTDTLKQDKDNAVTVRRALVAKQTLELEPKIKLVGARWTNP